MLDNKDIKHILIPRFDTFGDIILFEGFVEKLSRYYPDAIITLLVRSGYEQLAPLFPAFLRWMITDLDPYKPLDKMYADQINTKLSDLLSQLSQTKWDILLLSTFNRTWIEEVVSAGIACRYRIALGDTMLHEELVHWVAKSVNISPNVPIDKFVAANTETHETEKYQVLSNDLFDEVATLPAPKLRVPSEYQDAAQQICMDLNIDKRSYFVCLPAGLQNNAIKGWPLECYAEIVAWVFKEHGLSPLLVGHKSESAVLTDTQSLIEKHGISAALWAGDDDNQFPVLAAIMQNARLFIGNDSGPMHVAATLGIPSVGIFGGGNYLRFLPYGKRSLGIIGEMPCFGCGWDCIFEDAPCVKLVTVSDVMSAIHTVLYSDLNSQPGFHRASGSIDKVTAEYIRKAKKKVYTISSKLQIAEKDRAARLEVIHDLGRKLQESEADRASRLQVIHDLGRKLQEFEADRSARLLELSKIRGSLSWRMTAPLRWLDELLRRK